MAGQRSLINHISIKEAVLIVFALSTPFAGLSYASELDKIIEKVQESFDGARAMTASFSQEAVNKGFGRVTVSHGVMAMQKPLKMRWEYKEPAGLLLVADGKNLWYYDPEDNVAYFDSLAGHLNPRSPALFLAGEEPLLSLFDISLAPAGKEDKLNTISLRLFPKEPQPGVKAILLRVNSETFEIVEILMVDYLGNKNRLTFSNVDRDAKPDPSLFQFAPPKGARVKAMSKILGQ